MILQVHFQFLVTGKEGHTIPRSGLTPTQQPLLGEPNKTPLEYEKALEYIRYQRKHINLGWSLKDFDMMEVLPEKPKVNSSVSVLSMSF